MRCFKKTPNNFYEKESGTFGEVLTERESKDHENITCSIACLTFFAPFIAKFFAEMQICAAAHCLAIAQHHAVFPAFSSPISNRGRRITLDTFQGISTEKLIC